MLSHDPVIHPRLAVTAVDASEILTSDVLKATGVLVTPNNPGRKLVGAISVDGQGNGDASFLFLVSRKSLGGQSSVWEGFPEYACFVHVEYVSRDLLD